MHTDVSLLLPESEVASVAPVDADLLIRFSAACVVRIDVGEGEKPIQGFARGIVLQLHGAQIVAAHEPLLGRISDGRLQAGGEWLKALALPFECEGSVRLELAFANRSELVATGSGIMVRFDAEPNFTESLAC